MGKGWVVVYIQSELFFDEWQDIITDKKLGVRIKSSRDRGPEITNKIKRMLSLTRFQFWVIGVGLLCANFERFTTGLYTHLIYN